MTPQEKAEELISKMWVYAIPNSDGSWRNAKQCALIAVDEILNVLSQNEYLEDRGEYCENRERLYWQEVKQEIEKL